MLDAKTIQGQQRYFDNKSSDPAAVADKKLFPFATQATEQVPGASIEKPRVGNQLSCLSTNSQC